MIEPEVMNAPERVDKADIAASTRHGRNSWHSFMDPAFLARMTTSSYAACKWVTIAEGKPNVCS